MKKKQCYIVFTPDASDATKYYRSHYNQWWYLHWMLCDSIRQIPDKKLLPRSIYDVLTQIYNHFQRSLYRLVATRRVRCRHGITNLSRKTEATSASNHRPSAPWVISSAGKLIWYLHWSYFSPYRFTNIFLFSFFICHLYLSIARLMSVLCTERSLLQIMSRHSPYC